MSDYVVDTHGLLWYLSDDEQLGKEAEKVLEKAEQGENYIYVPSIVVVEAVDRIRKSRVDVDLSKLVTHIKSAFNYEIYPLNEDIVWEYVKNEGDIVENEIHDSIILISAKQLGEIAIITKDQAIQEQYSNVIW